MANSFHNCHDIHNHERFCAKVMELNLAATKTPVANTKRLRIELARYFWAGCGAGGEQGSRAR